MSTINKTSIVDYLSRLLFIPTYIGDIRAGDVFASGTGSNLTLCEVVDVQDDGIILYRFKDGSAKYSNIHAKNSYDFRTAYTKIATYEY